MALDKTTLANSIRVAFEKAKNTPTPEDPADIDPVQLDILRTLASDLADAIDLYVRGGDITDVETQVSNIAGTVIIGQGKQNNTVNIT